MTEKKYTTYTSCALLMINPLIFQKNDMDTLSYLYHKVIIWANEVGINSNRKILSVYVQPPNEENPLSIMYSIIVEIECTEEEKKYGLRFGPNV